jgi:hypothetical protein
LKLKPIRDNAGGEPGVVGKTRNDHNPDCNLQDPLVAWFGLAKSCRNRRQKTSWKRGKQHGRMDTFLAAKLILFIVTVLLLAGGLNHG